VISVTAASLPLTTSPLPLYAFQILRDDVLETEPLETECEMRGDCGANIIAKQCHYYTLTCRGHDRSSKRLTDMQNTCTASYQIHDCIATHRRTYLCFQVIHVRGGILQKTSNCSFQKQTLIPSRTSRAMSGMTNQAFKSSKEPVYARKYGSGRGSRLRQTLCMRPH
jgi:hypothetical protein